MNKKYCSENLHQEINREYETVINHKEKPRILIVTPEVTDLPEGMGNAAHIITAKGGGLGDISASLIHYLNASNRYELHVVLPKYDKSIKDLADITNEEIDRLAIILSGKGIHLINDSAFSYISNPYQDHIVHTRIRRAFAMQRFVINELLDKLKPDVVHCNDWMTGLIPPAAKAKGIKTLFTLHNIFTEKQTLMDIELSGLKPMEFAENLYYDVFPENIKENWSKYFSNNPVDFTASAIYAADIFNTVSETFLHELTENVFEDIVPQSIYKTIKDKAEEKRAFGIINAPNDKICPELLPNIVNFSVNNVIEKKVLNKLDFQEQMGLPKEPDTPLFFWPNRLYYQKAPDLLLDIAEYLIHKYQMQLAVVANGDPLIEEKFKLLDRKYKAIAYRTFNDNLSNLGKAGSDFILMPSRYEPCGIPQMEATRFGTLPVIRATGGLKDTILHLDFINDTGNGFVFHQISKEGLEFAVKEALMFYAQPFSVRKKNIQRIMRQSKEDFNLEKTAGKYIELYDKLISGNF